MYEVFLERTVERDLRRLPGHVFKRVIHVVRNLENDPRPPGCRKIVGSKSDWRVRVGNYRIINELDDKAAAVRVMRVPHRREAYR